MLLLVDDDPAAIRLLGIALTSSGFEIKSAGSAEEALAVIGQIVPDAVVLDYAMPGLDGADFCARLRKMEDIALREVPVVMLTAFDGEAEELKCLAAGANDFVSKPVSVAVLTARIRTQLRLRAYARELEEWTARHEADLACARSIQQGLMPQNLPESPDWEVETRHMPLLELGGDIYGWEELSDGRWLIWIADAVGHGTGAALVTTLIAHLFAKSSGLAVSPSAVLGLVNHEFARAMAGHTFMTACCAILEPDGSVVFSGAGHPPVLLRRRDGTVQCFESDKAMMGVTSTLVPEDNAVSLSEGDVLLLYTDGLYSRSDPEDVKASPHVVQAALQKGELAPKMIDDLLARMGVRSDSSPAIDDLAVIAVRRLS